MRKSHDIWIQDRTHFFTSGSAKVVVSCQQVLLEEVALREKRGITRD